MLPYSNIVPGITLGSIKQIFFQDVRNVIRIPKARRHTIDALELGISPQLPGIKFLNQRFEFESDFEGWTNQNVQITDGAVHPDVSPPSFLAYIQNSFMVTKYGNYEIEVKHHDENNGANAIRIVVSDGSSTLVHEDFESFPGSTSTVSFNAGNKTEITVIIGLLYQDDTNPFYINRVDISASVNLFHGMVDYDDAVFQEDVQPTSSGRLAKSTIQAFIPGDDQELDFLFSNMVDQGFIAIAEDENQRMRIIGSIDVPASFKYEFTTNKSIDKPAGYKIRFEANAMQSAFSFVGLPTCEVLHSDEPFPWLLNAAISPSDVANSWLISAGDYYLKKNAR